MSSQNFVTRPGSQFVQSGTGAVERTVESKLQDVVSVKDFGAVGDGVADDTAAIQAAIDFACTSHRALYFPSSKPAFYYKITSPLTITKPISIYGEGPISTVLYAVGLTPGQYVLDFDCLAADVVEHVTIQDLTIRSSDGVPDGVLLKNVSYALLKNILLYNLYKGIVVDGTRCFTNTFENINSYNITSNSIFFQANFTGGGHFTFLGCTFTGDTAVAVPSTAYLDNLCFEGCNWEQCVTNGLFIAGTCAGLSVTGCRTEGCNSTDFVLRPALATEYVGGINVVGNVFSASDNGSVPKIQLGGSLGKIRGFSITGNVVTHGTDSFSSSLVELNGDGESGLIAGNMLRGTAASAVNTKRSGVIVYGNENLSGKLEEQWGASSWGVVEGTFTPTDGSGAGLSLTAASGLYTKIGRMVFWQVFISYPVNADATAAEFAGLPFAVGGLTGDTPGRSGATINVTNYGSSVGLLQGLNSGTTNVAFRDGTTGGSLTNADISGKYFYCSGMYSI